MDPILSLVQTSKAAQLAVKLAYYRRNPHVFFDHQLKIRTKEGTLENFALWPCQAPVMDKLYEMRKRRGWVRLVVLKARQVGMSTFAEGLMSWATMLNPNTNGLVVAHDKPTAETLFKMCRTYYDYLETGIRPIKRYSTKSEFVFENPDDLTRSTNPGLGSTLIITSANNIHSGIGRTLRAVHISEVARYPSPEGIIDGIFPALAKTPGTVCIIESTARYSGHWFRSQCERAKAGDGDFEFVFVPWYLNPGYAVPLLPGEELKLSIDERHLVDAFSLTLEQVKFFRQELATMGNEALFAQSYPFTEDQAWITPGDNAFPWDKLDQLREKARSLGGPIKFCDIDTGPILLDHPTGKLRIWEMPDKGKQYDIGVDVALGTSVNDTSMTSDAEEEGDWSVMCVIQRGTNRQVAEWRSRSVNVMKLAEIAAALGYFYNQAQIAVEVNGIGVATNMNLSQMGYPNIYVWRYRDERSTRFSKKVGWETNYKTKKWLISFAVNQIINDNVTVRSLELLDEMRQFIHLGNERYGAAAGSYDDRVMAFLIALTASDDENFEKWISGTQSRVAKATQDDPRVIIPDKGPWNTAPSLDTASGYKYADAWD